MRALLTGIFLLMCSVACFAQRERQYTFVHYGTDKGLAAYDVTGVIQDEAGFIWTATVSGLQRFDGTRFITFHHQPEDPQSIPENHILQMLRDSNKNLWLLTASGEIGIFDTRHFTYKKAEVKPGNPRSLLADKRLYSDSRGNVYLICLRTELLTWTAATNTFSQENTPFTLPNGWWPLSLYDDKTTGKNYIGTDSGLLVFNPASRNLNYRNHNLDKEEVVQRLGHIMFPAPMLVDSKHRLWFHSWLPSAGSPLFYCYDVQKNRVILEKYSFNPLIKEYHEPAGMIEQRNGTVWIRGTNIFVRYIEKENDFQLVHNGYSNDQSISYEHIYDVREDREENLWVATNNNGLYRFNPGKEHFMNVRHINRNKNVPGEGGVISFANDVDGSLLVSAWGNGIYRYDSSFNNIPVNINGIVEKNSVSAWDMCCSRDGRTIWMGIQPGAICAYDIQTKKATFYELPILEQSTVRQLEEDREGNLWIGTQWKGLYKYTRGKGPHNFKERVEKITDVDARLVHSLALDSTGRIWVGTNTGGAYVIDPATNKVVLHLTEEGEEGKRLNTRSVNTIFIYNDTTAVIGGEVLNVYNMRTKTVKSIKWPSTLQPGVMSIQKDRNGYIWIALTSGITRYSLGSRIFIHFDRIDGIANDHFLVSASAALPDGRLVFGNSNQFIVFDPQKINLADSLPDVSITGFKVRHEVLSVDSLMKRKLIELQPDENSVYIDFSALNFLSAYIIRYKLEGIDKEWVRADMSNQAVYPYLPPGTYTFMAQTEDSEGKPGKNITTLIIKIKPHFWETWWFFGLIVFAGVGVFLWVDKMRTQKIKEMESVRTRIASSLTEDMSNSLSSINITSELAKTRVDNDTERTREYINQISDGSNRMVQAMYDMVWSINPENDTLQHTVERMKDFASEIESQFDPNIVFQVDERANEIRLRMETRYEVLSIYKEALSNAARHANAKYISVNITYKKPGILTLNVSDDGRGFDVDAMALSRGVNEMRRRAVTINASISIKSEINTGTTVKLVVGSKK